MAKPNKKGPVKTVDVICSRCKTLLFKYRKGALVKCFKERISKDFTLQAGVCPECQMVFGRETLVRGTPAYKIIGGKAVAK
ncbi:hypothetical protein VXS04_09440 [Photobacterium piscicola]|uniref:hypothetical protein n=1 Tax=Photobacterium piscicola TaxID=1378299 RepID=UPI002E16C1E4|nr:hypothetical protein [Photobacterium piscicola]